MFQVQVAVDTRTVDRMFLTQVTGGLVFIKLTALFVNQAKVYISVPLGSRLKQYYSVHLFQARARLDLPTFDDEAVQRHLDDASHIQGQSVAWSTLKSIFGLASVIIQVVSQASVLWQVLKNQPDGALLAALSAVHSVSDLIYSQRRRVGNGGMLCHL